MVKNLDEHICMMLINVLEDLTEEGKNQLIEIFDSGIENQAENLEELEKKIKKKKNRRP